MAQIGTFTRDETGAYAGTIKTLTLNLKASIKPCDRDNERAPDFRVTAVVSSSEPAGAAPPAKRAPSTFRSSSTIRPSPLRSILPSSRATKESTSSSGPADQHHGAPLTAGRPHSIT
ncbi:uncharacterized protein DUF736 [Rhizobium sp. BK251]|nr:uncharacterized protein DUF736 [Rhizobium sp. BK251]